MDAPSSKRPILALVLGLLAFGLGHVYAGRWKAGLALLLGGTAVLSGVLTAAAVAGVTTARLVLGMLGIAAVAWAGQAVWAMRLAKRPVARPASRMRAVLPYVAFGAVAILMPTGHLRELVVETYSIPGGSMLPTIQIGDQVSVVKVGEARVPRRGELAVFRAAGGTTYLKRVVALGGDEVMIRGHVLYVNSEPAPAVPGGATTVYDREGPGGPWRPVPMNAVRETLGARTYGVLYDPVLVTGASDYGPFVVPAGHFFALGDNRDRSFDSRAFGPVPLEDYIGRPDSVFWSSGPEGLRVERIGLRL